MPQTIKPPRSNPSSSGCLLFLIESTLFSASLRMIASCIVLSINAGAMSLGSLTHSSILPLIFVHPHLAVVDRFSYHVSDGGCNPGAGAFQWLSGWRDTQIVELFGKPPKRCAIVETIKDKAPDGNLTPLPARAVGV